MLYIYDPAALHHIMIKEADAYSHPEHMFEYDCFL